MTDSGLLRFDCVCWFKCFWACFCGFVALRLFRVLRCLFVYWLFTSCLSRRFAVWLFMFTVCYDAVCLVVCGRCVWLVVFFNDCCVGVSLELCVV